MVVSNSLGVLTVGAIAARAGVPVHRVTYVIKSRRIRSVGRVGQARAFDESAVEQILEELSRIEQLKTSMASCASGNN